MDLRGRITQGNKIDMAMYIHYVFVVSFLLFVNCCCLTSMKRCHTRLRTSVLYAREFVYMDGKSIAIPQAKVRLFAMSGGGGKHSKDYLVS